MSAINSAGMDETHGFFLRTRMALVRTLLPLVGKLFLGLESFYGRASRFGDREFFDAKDFPWVGEVEADWPKVRAELDALLPYAAYMPNFQDISRDQISLSQDDGWKTFFFCGYGLKGVANCRRCPETTKILKKMPGMRTAFFSILAPGKHLPPHRGYYKGVLRLHLGLLIPEPAEICAIRVGSQTRHWQEGRVMIFDDTFEHEAWNRTDGARVVLFVDIMRPMRFPANMLNAVMIWVFAVSPFLGMLGAFRNYLRWEKRSRLSSIRIIDVNCLSDDNFEPVAVGVGNFAATIAAYSTAGHRVRRRTDRGRDVATTVSCAPLIRR